MYNRNYYKVYIMLKETSEGGACYGGVTGGSAALEIRRGMGRAAIYVQGLNPGSYYVFLTASDDGSSAAMGEVSVDNRGRGEYVWFFDPDNVSGTGLAIEKLDSVVITKDGKSPLFGSLNAEAGWHGILKAAAEDKIEKQKQNQKQERQFQKQDNESDNDNEQEQQEQCENDEKELYQSSDDDSSLYAASEDCIEYDGCNTIDSTIAADTVDNSYNNVASEQEQDVVVKDEQTESNLKNSDKNTENSGFTAFGEVDSFKRIIARFKKEIDEIEKMGILKPEDLDIVNNFNNQQSKEKDADENIQAYQYHTVDEEIKQNNDTDCDNIRHDNTNEDINQHDNTDIDIIQHQNTYMGDNDADVMPEVKEEHQQNVSEETTSQNESDEIPAPTITNNPQNEISDIDYIFTKNRRLYPFGSDGIDWRAASWEEAYIFNTPTIIFTEPFVIYCYRKYSHMLLGRDGSGKMFLGAPDIYDADNAHRAALVGFTAFKLLKTEEAGDKKYGYWIREVK